MFFNLALIVSVFANISCSSNSKYNVVALEPTLAIKAPQGPYTDGQPFTAEAMIEQEGLSGDFLLSIVVIAGKTTITIDGSDISTAGDWTTISGKSAKLTITPNATEDLLISFQAKSPNGLCSDKYLLRGHVNATSELSVKAVYESKYVNPDISTLIPIHLMIDKEGYAGQFIVEATITKGDGSIYDDEKHIIDGLPHTVSADSFITYHPKIIGEHIITLTISAEKATKTIRTYIEVVKNISVVSIIQKGFSIKGIGEHHVDGQTITLALQNDDKYNFEVAGWYDHNTGKLLSSNPTFSILLSLECVADLEIKLKPRTVNITRDGIYKQELNYLIQENGKPVPKVAYNYRTQFIADYKVSDPIRFSYEEYRFDMSTIPPKGKKCQAGPSFGVGTSLSGYFYRIDNNFQVYLKQSDNPGFYFNTYSRYIEAGGTRYNIPTNIIMQ